MKKKILVFTCLVLCYISIFAENLYLFKYNNKYGYINDKKEVVIKPQYDFANDFYSDYAIVGFINEKGKHFYSLINKKNEHIKTDLIKNDRVFLVSDNLFYISSERVLYFADLEKCVKVYDFESERIYSGKPYNIGVFYEKGAGFLSTKNIFYKIKGDWNYIYPMHNDLAFAKGTDASQVLIDIEGNVVIKDVFDCASEFSEGFMSISTKNDSGYINNKGEYIIHCSFEPNFHEFYPPGINYPFREGIAIPQVNYKIYKMYDNKGKEIMSETRLNYCSYCSNGLILCQKEENGKFGYLNKKGKQEINFIFDSASDFYNGYAQVVYQGKDGVIDKKGNLYFSEDIINRNKKSSLNVK